MNIKTKILKQIKFLLALIFYYCGIFYLVRIFNNFLGKRLTIVTYHRVGDKPIDKIACSLPFLFVTDKTFDCHIRFFKKHYRITNFGNIENLSRKKIPKNSLIITFDDGYADNYKIAFPILEKYRTNFTIFLTTNMIEGNKVPWWDELYALMSMVRENKIYEKVQNDKMLQIFNDFIKNPAKVFYELNSYRNDDINSIIKYFRKIIGDVDDLIAASNLFLAWNEINEMKEAVEFGSHTCSHIPLTMIEKTKDLQFELLNSKEEIEKQTGKRVTALSYPAGSYNDNVKSSAQQAGYSWALSQRKGINNLEDRYVLKRINVWEGTSEFNKKFSKSLFALNLYL